jgi:hypothetical protein
MSTVTLIDSWPRCRETTGRDWKVDIGNAGLLMGSTEAQLEQQILQGQLDTVKVKGHATDHELAAAIRAAVGDAKLDWNGREIPQGPPQPAMTRRRRPISYRCQRRAGTPRFRPRRRRTTAPPMSVIT